MSSGPAVASPPVEPRSPGEAARAVTGLSRRGGNGLTWWLARRYLASSRAGGRFLSFITSIALGGVVVGVTALIVVIGVMTGMQEELRSKILESTPHVLVLQQGSALRMNDWQRVAAEARSVDGVVAAAPFVLTQVGVLRSGTEYAQPADLYGVALESDDPPATEMERKIQEGAHDLRPTASGLPPILMGSRLAARMHVFVGDTLSLMALESAEIDPFFGTPSPKVRNFEVTGTFTTGMYDYDAKNAYVTLSDAQNLLGLAEHQVGGLRLRLNDPDRAVTISGAVRDRLGLAYYAESWTVTNQDLFAALKLEKLAMTLILFLIVIVAAFNIVGTLVMVVVDRTREIGILKSMGMRSKGILRVFMMQGLWIGAIGTGIGTGLGLLIGWLIDRYEIIPIPPEVYFVDRLPVVIRPTDVLIIVAGSIMIAFLATIYPSLRASRLEPVDAIRHE